MVIGKKDESVLYAATVTTQIVGQILPPQKPELRLLLAAPKMKKGAKQHNAKNKGLAISQKACFASRAPTLADLNLTRLILISLSLSLLSVLDLHPRHRYTAHFFSHCHTSTGPRKYRRIVIVSLFRECSRKHCLDILPSPPRCSLSSLACLCVFFTVRKPWQWWYRTCESDRRCPRSD